MGIVPEHSNSSVSPLCQSSIPYLYGINKAGDTGHVYRTVPNGIWEKLTYGPIGTASFTKIVVADDKIYGMGKDGKGIYGVYRASATSPGQFHARCKILRYG